MTTTFAENRQFLASLGHNLCTDSLQSLSCISAVSLQSLSSLSVLKLLDESTVRIKSVLR